MYAVALLASGQSTTISCTFAGQVIMQVTIPIPGVIQFIYANYSEAFLSIIYASEYRHLPLQLWAVTGVSGHEDEELG